MKFKRLLVIGDTHCGSLLGLTPPEYQSDDNRDWLGPFWEWYTSTLEQIGPVDALVHLGDAIDGMGRKESTQHLTTNLNKQVDMAVQCIEAVRAKCRYLVRGTGYHTDLGGSFEDFVAEQLKIDAHDELRLEINGRKFHARHVVGRSDIPYGQYTQDAKEATNEILQSELEDYDYADMLGRAHVHYNTGVWYWDSKRQVKREVWTNPALQLRGPVQTAFVRKLRTWMYHVGLTLLEVDRHGEHFIRPIICPIKLYYPSKGEYIHV